MNVQAYILTLTYETSLDELAERLDADGCDIITFLHSMQRNDVCDYVAPNWTTSGDIVFFYFAKSSINTIRKLKRECEKLSDTDDRKEEFYFILENAEELYRQIGGCIFAVGRVCENSTTGRLYEASHFKNRVFADVTDFAILRAVITLETFSKFAPLEFKRSITPVLGESFEQLKNIIQEYNYVDYLANVHSVPVPLKDISDKNWISLTMDYRRKFFLELQFRKYYVDYFLKNFGDFKKIHAECTCFRNGKRTGIADNCIKFNGRYVFVEVKLNIKTVPHFEAQLDKYCNIDAVKILEDKQEGKEKIVQEHAFALDVNGFCLYHGTTKKIELIENLDNIKAICDIKRLREKCIKIIGN